SHWIENLTFDDKGMPCAVYHIPLDNYSHISSSDIISVFSRMASMYETIERDFKLLSLCKIVSSNEYDETMKNKRDNVTDYYTEYQDHINSAKTEISRLASWKRELFLVLPLKRLK